MKNSSAIKLLSLPVLLSLPLMSLAADWSNSVSSELRYFTDDAAFSEQSNSNIALGFNSEFEHEFESGKSFNFKAFARLDENDNERDHIDIGELYWTIPGENWVLSAGINKVFWGVAESQNIVNIINQTDQLESSSADDKLGQPMINLNRYFDWGVVDLYALPYFIERQYGGSASRFRGELLINDQASYESKDKEKHLDWAARWSHNVDIWDIGLSYFEGTSREPTFNFNGSSLTPFYAQIKQFGLDIQATTESWLWKLESIERQGKTFDNYQQAVLGLEYTFYGINDSDIDLGIVSEYLYDSRADSQQSNPFEDDLLIATRLAFNDVQSTEILAGVITDLDESSYSISLEASRRLGQNFKLSVESNIFKNIKATDKHGFLKQDSYLEADLTYYFN